ncbi:Vesicle transport protein GOT1A [Thelohanellus kitauei]|uniref:Vesicle transport protein GOT1A n=1 Tax=Thelohanellus kitauei TaxID=669202 RepID=A0A0C2N1B7_THEKT|nr:Vesicle transport protein GOT1A [Thelohanellus kitauei]
MQLNERQKIGLYIVGFGAVFYTMGIFLFLDRVLISFGNILMVSGILTIMGLSKGSRFLFTPGKLKGTFLFLVGFFLVIIKWSFLGTIMELVGIFLLFSGFIPTVFGFLTHVPIVGPFFDYLFSRNIFGTSFRKSIV